MMRAGQRERSGTEDSSDFCGRNEWHITSNKWHIASFGDDHSLDGCVSHSIQPRLGSFALRDNVNKQW